MAQPWHYDAYAGKTAECIEISKRQIKARQRERARIARENGQAWRKNWRGR